MALALSLSESQDAQREVGLESAGAGWKGNTTEPMCFFHSFPSLRITVLHGLKYPHQHVHKLFI